MAMKSMRWSQTLVVCGLLLVVLVTNGFAQKETSKVAGFKPRLPNYYAKLGLTETQRTKIYEIQGKYNDEISELQKKIDELKVREDKEVVLVLTPTQQKLLQHISIQSSTKSTPKK
jgi:Spy/CpxP family protein refolding chaperone